MPFAKISKVEGGMISASNSKGKTICLGRRAWRRLSATPVDDLVDADAARNARTYEAALAGPSGWPKRATHVPRPC